MAFRGLNLQALAGVALRSISIIINELINHGASRFVQSECIDSFIHHWSIYYKSQVPAAEQLS
jgi:hypothetical protein